jgi:hypothetical protein
MARATSSLFDSGLVSACMAEIIVQSRFDEERSIVESWIGGHGHHRRMSELPESRTEPTVAAELPLRSDRPNRLAQAVAWVGIVAGVVFIVAVVFYSGFFVGKQYDGRYRGGHGMYYPGGTMGPGGMMGPGGTMGPGGMMGPGMMRPGQQQSPTTTTAVPSTP